MKTYLVVTNDKYELPVAEACSQAEIARRLNYPLLLYVMR